MTDKQKKCVHQWVAAKYSKSGDYYYLESVYCPNCKLKEEIK